MKKEAAIHQFWSSFGLPAYEENSVPSGKNAPDFPYVTYNVALGGFGTETALHGNVWYRDTSRLGGIEKSEEIFQAIGPGGVFLPCDGGAVWLKRGTPFAQAMGEDSDRAIKRQYINITAEFLTAD